MRIKKVKIKTLSLFVVFFLSSCNKEPQTTKENKLEPKEFGGQKYLTESPTEESKNDEQWKKKAEQYLEMNEGDTMTVYDNEPKKYIKETDTEEENYEPFVNVKPLSETERKEQLKRRNINAKYYIENKNHTWRRVSKRKYEGQ